MRVAPPRKETPMPTQIDEVVQLLRRTVHQQVNDGLTDGHLLTRFIEHRDRAAVTALVQRHGPMVLGVCRRILRDPHDAEDAFQATFLVLVRKAPSVRQRELVANWLYGVAHQTALKARAMRARRGGRERQVEVMPETEAPQLADTWRDLQSCLDQELSRLPEKYRVAIVSCDLEGKTRKEVARQLGLPEGTVAGRLNRGRSLLAKRLSRNGVALSSGTLAAVVAQNAATASVPPALLSSTIEAATQFALGEAAVGAISVNVAVVTEGVLKTMLLNKLKGVVALLMLAVGLVALGGTLIHLQTAKAQESRPQAEGRNPDWPTSTANRGTARTAAATLPSDVASFQLVDYKTLFGRTLAVMADYFESIEYANQYDGRIEARTLVPLERLPGVFRLGTVNIQTSAIGGYMIQIRVNRMKEGTEKTEIVGRDKELEVLILQRLKRNRTTIQNKGAGDKPRAADNTVRIQPGDRLYVRVADTFPGNDINGGFRVEPSGKVPLGPRYGRAQVSGLTPEEAEIRVRDHLKSLLHDPQVSLTWYDSVVHGARQAGDRRPQVPAD
jgi:RNA polymerase sigma factor (sigma-70 family)